MSADELTLLMREIRAKPAPGRTMDDAIAVLRALPRPAPPPEPEVAVEAAAPLPLPAATVEPPPSPAPAPVSVVRLWSDLSDEVCRGRKVGPACLAAALALVRSQDVRFVDLIPERPTAANAVGLLHALDLALGAAPGRSQFLTRRRWKRLRRDFSARLLELYNAGDLDDADPGEVEALWVRSADALRGT